MDFPFSSYLISLTPAVTGLLAQHLTLLYVGTSLLFFGLIILSYLVLHLEFDV